MNKLVLCIFLLAILNVTHGKEQLIEGVWKSTPINREWHELIKESPWQNNTLGNDHSVPEPWTEMQTSKTAIKCWNRTVEFAGHALPQQLISANETLLEGPFKIRVHSEGKWHESSAGTGRIIKKFPDKVVWEGKCNVNEIPVVTKIQVEFDGFSWITLQFGPTPSGIKIKRLTLDIPILRHNAEYYWKSFEGYAPFLIKDMWGKVKNRKMNLQRFTLASDKRGMSFFAEGLKGWILDRRSRQVEWLPSEDAVTVRFNIIDSYVARALEKQHTVQLGYTTLPIRPFDRKLRRYIVNINGREPEYYKGIAGTDMSLASIRLTSFIPDNAREAKHKKTPVYIDSYVPIENAEPFNPEAFKKYIKLWRDKYPRTKLALYTVGNEHNILDPVFRKNYKAWSATTTPLTKNDLDEALQKAGQAPGTRYVCGWNQEYIDYKVFYLLWWFDKLGLDGYYYDNQTFVPCNNPAHKEHQFKDHKGRFLSIAPIRQYRQMMKRVYKEIKKRKKDSIIIGHGIPMSAPFCDIAIDGECLLKLAGEHGYYTHFVSAEDCRTPYFSGHLSGFAKLLLPEYRSKFAWGKQSVKPTRAMLSLLWMADLSYWRAWSNGNVLDNDARVRGEFKIWEAEYVPYWEHQTALVDIKDVYVTIYSKKQAALLAVSSPTPQTPAGEATVSIDLNKLFPELTFEQRRQLSAFDAETGDALEFRKMMSMNIIGMDINVNVPNQDFRLIEIK